jgi:hypothetical protein
VKDLDLPRLALFWNTVRYWRVHGICAPRIAAGSKFAAIELNPQFAGVPRALSDVLLFQKAQPM